MSEGKICHGHRHEKFEWARRGQHGGEHHLGCAGEEEELKTQGSWGGQSRGFVRAEDPEGDAQMCLALHSVFMSNDL